MREIKVTRDGEEITIKISYVDEEVTNDVKVTLDKLSEYLTGYVKIREYLGHTVPSGELMDIVDKIFGFSSKDDFNVIGWPLNSNEVNFRDL